MNKELEALERLYCAGNLELDYVCSNKHKEDFAIIEKALKVIDLINQRGIKLIIPEGTFSKEHIDIQLFTNCLSKDEFELIKEVLDL